MMDVSTDDILSIWLSRYACFASDSTTFKNFHRRLSSVCVANVSRQPLYLYGCLDTLALQATRQPLYLFDYAQVHNSDNFRTTHNRTILT